MDPETETTEAAAGIDSKYLCVFRISQRDVDIEKVELFSGERWSWVFQQLRPESMKEPGLQTAGRRDSQREGRECADPEV